MIKKISAADRTIQMTQEELQDLVIETESGARRPSNKLVMGAMIFLALAWAMFQLWIASPLPYVAAEHLGIPVLDDTKTRAIHLTFGLLLTFLAYPASKRPLKKVNYSRDRKIGVFAAILVACGAYIVAGDMAAPDSFYYYALGAIGVALIGCFLIFPIAGGAPRSYVPLVDWVIALTAAYCAIYTIIYYDELAARSGLATTLDVTVGFVGIILLMEAARRALGLPLVVIALVFLVYTIAGNADFIPDVIKHKGHSLAKTVSHQWLTTEGVFGIAIGVSTSFVFLFVLFGALLDKAGAGNYFIKLAFSILGHLRGGPAKAAVVSSGMMGLISGSSIASTVTIGTFTIPLMKRVGFTGTKAGAVEVASAVNAQIMPPVMGAAAFIIAERVNIPYFEVVKHAFLPAIISYIALFYIVHIEAVKANIQPLPKVVTRTFKQSMIVWGLVISTLILLSGIIYVVFGETTCMGPVCVNGLKYYTGDYNLQVVGGILMALYIYLLYYTTRVPELKLDDPNSPVVELGETAPIFKAGLHYLLPIFVLIWCLMVERLSAGLSAFWATSLMMFILITQRPLRAFMMKSGNYFSNFKQGLLDLFDGLVMGSRNMVGIAIATAAAGIIVGTVSLTGVGQVLTEVVEVIAGNNILLILLLTAVISLVLGMGLPTTANYIVVSSLMTGVIVELGAANGLIVPLIAVHLFVFYFGIMADITPPVGLASFGAAAISGADPIKTGIQGFVYALRTAILPFFFIFDPEILMIGIDSAWELIWVVVKTTVALMLFSAASQNYFIVRCKWYETVLLFLITFTLFAPQFWIDRFVPAFTDSESKQVELEMQRVIDNKILPDRQRQIKILAKGENRNGNEIEVESFIPVIGFEAAEEALRKYGLMYLSDDERGQRVYEVEFGTPAFRTGIEFDFTVINIQVPQEQPNKRFAAIPAILLLLFVVLSQIVRLRGARALRSLSKA